MNFNIYKFAIAIVVLFMGLSACNLEREIDLELPEYESQLVVECYLEVGLPMTLSLSRSAGYFDVFPTEADQFFDDLLEQEATVTITHKGEVYELENTLFFNPITQKVFNYVAPIPVPEDYDSDFELEITTKDGEVITGTTRLLPKVGIDSLVVRFTGQGVDTLGQVLTYFKDDTTQTNYYRRMLHHNSLIDSLQQDFVTDDSFVDNGNFVFGTGYDFPIGDTVYSSIMHIDQAYFDFIESVFLANDSNGNPFGQPSTIKSNVQGEGNPIGVFTGIAFEREEVIITK